MKKSFKLGLIVLAVILFALFLLLSWGMSLETYRCDRIENEGFPLTLIGLFC